MFSYFLNRWLFARRFESRDGAFVYRRRPHLPGIPVNDDERLQCLKIYRTKYWKQMIIMMTLFLAAMIAVAVVAAMLPDATADEFIALAAYVACLVFVVIFLRKHFQLERIPEELFEERTMIPSEQPDGSWLARYRALARRRSWPAHILMMAFYGALTWFLIPEGLGTSPMGWVAFLLFAACLVAVAYGMWIKVRGLEPTG